MIKFLLGLLLGLLFKGKFSFSIDTEKKTDEEEKESEV